VQSSLTNDRNEMEECNLVFFSLVSQKHFPHLIPLPACLMRRSKNFIILFARARRGRLWGDEMNLEEPRGLRVGKHSAIKS
jgi:hypothetical protein